MRNRRDRARRERVRRRRMGDLDLEKCGLAGAGGILVWFYFLLFLAGCVDEASRAEINDE